MFKDVKAFEEASPQPELLDAPLDKINLDAPERKKEENQSEPEEVKKESKKEIKKKTKKGIKNVFKKQGEDIKRNINRRKRL